MAVKAKATITLTRVNDGAQGPAGNGIKSTAVTYQAGISGTEKPTGEWTTNIPLVSQGQYLWCRTVITYTDETTSEAYSVAYIPNNGSTGETGTGIDSITQEYYLSDSKEGQSGGSWVTSMPNWSKGKYLWTRYKITYKNPTSTEYTSPICDSSWEAVNDVEEGLEQLRTEYKADLKLEQNRIEAVVEATDNLGTRVSTVEQTAKEIELKVKELDLSGDDIIARINLTATTATILAEKINLSGYVTFSNLSEAGQTIINADNIITGNIKGCGIYTDWGRIGKWQFNDKAIINEYIAGVADMGRTGLSAGINTADGTVNAATGLAFWAGAPWSSTPTPGFATKLGSAPFRVYANGDLHASNVYIKGNITATGGQLGAWTITHAEVNNGTWGTGWGTGFGQKNGASWNPNEMAFWAGDGKFRVNYDGTLRSTSANITGTIDATSIRIKNNINIYDSDGVNRIALTAPIGSAGSSLNVGSGFQSVYIKGCIFRNGVLQVGEDTSFTLATGFVNSQGQITANLNLGSTAQFRAVCGNYGFLIRNDGANTYFMTTNSGDPYGSWVPNRWFQMQMSTGIVHFNAGIRTADLGGAGLLPVIHTRTTEQCIYRMAAMSATRIDVATKTYGVNRITTASSDIRLKENIFDTEVNALSVIDRIKMRQFDWKANKDHWDIGMIADELEILDSKLTMGGGYDAYGNMDVKSIDTFYMLGYVVKGIQELHALLTDLEKRIQKLERR